MTRKTPSPKPRDVVTLADLAPRHRITGGSQQRVFGADANAGAREVERPVNRKGASRPITGGSKSGR
jgi:hypothetical protein